MKRIALGLCLAAVLSLSASCIIAVIDEPIPGEDGTAFNYRKSAPFSEGGTISLVNTNGDIRVQGRGEARVEVLARELGKWSYPRRFRISGISSLEPEILFHLQDNAIKLQCPDDADEDSVYDFELRVPRSVKIEGIRNGEGTIRVSDIFGRLEVEAERGEVQIENFSGSLDVSLEEGNVSAEVLDLRSEDEIRIEVGEGDIEIFLQEPVGATIEADAEDGEVTSGIEFGRPLPAPNLSIKPESAIGRIILKTKSGDIRIRRSSGE